ncbi:MAG: hypothetical protein RI936_1031 [Pseudomonadota bacterium]
MIRERTGRALPRNAARLGGKFDSRPIYQRAGGLRWMVMLRFSTVT